MRIPIALLTVVVAIAAAAPAAAQAAATRSCPQSDPANGLSGLRAEGLPCKRAFAVARRTNSVKCFLTSRTCTHRFRGRSWTCTLDGTGSRVTCRSGGHRVKYRLG